MSRTNICRYNVSFCSINHLDTLREQINWIHREVKPFLRLVSKQPVGQRRIWFARLLVMRFQFKPAINSEGHSFLL